MKSGSIGPILTPIRTERVPAQPAVTTSKEYFEEAGAWIFWSIFGSQFFGLKVAATEAVELTVSLAREASSGAILKELGEKAEISVSQFWAFLDNHRDGSEWFVSFLRGKDGRLWAVGAEWDNEVQGWVLSACNKKESREWYSGFHVVSHK